jgi:hypothetical protein
MSAHMCFPLRSSVWSSPLSLVDWCSPVLFSRRASHQPLVSARLSPNSRTLKLSNSLSLSLSLSLRVHPQPSPQSYRCSPHCPCTGALFPGCSVTSRPACQTRSRNARVDLPFCVLPRRTYVAERVYSPETISTLADGVKAGDRRSLSRAITLGWSYTHQHDPRTNTHTHTHTHTHKTYTQLQTRPHKKT